MGRKPFKRSMEIRFVIRRLVPIAGALAALLVACGPPRVPAVQAPAPEQAAPGQAAPGPAGDSASAPRGAAGALPGDEPSPGSYLAGRYAYSQGDIAASADYLIQALEEDPDNLGLMRLTFRVALADGRTDVALPLAHELVRSDPLDGVVGLAVALEMIADGDNAGALDKLAAIPEVGLNSLLLPLVRAWAAYGTGGRDAALEKLEALRQNPDFAPFGDYHAGLISDLAGNTGDAEQLYMRAIENASGGTLRIVLALGGLYERTGRRDDAERIYTAFLASDTETLWLNTELDRLEKNEPAPRLVATVPEGVAEALFGAAGALPPGDSSDAALLHLQLALYLKPDFPMARILLGELFEDKGQLERALRAYQGIDPDGPAGWMARMRSAAVLDRLHRTDEAVAILERMADERPERTDALVLLGDILRSNERFAEAVAAYDKAVAREKTFEPDRWALFYARGVALERSKDWPRAEADFLKALELEPDQPYVLNYLGYSWVERGENLDKARTMIERAVALRPNDGFIVDSLGWVLYRTGDFAGAVEQLERAVELQPDDPTINDHLGDAYWKAGRRNEAAFQWNRALSFKPAPEDAMRIQEKLGKGLDGASG